jgi:EAL domain-containing protein (putative c-di-GMP-specific phosphodiesterase class I)
MEASGTIETDTKWYLESASSANTKVNIPIEPFPFTIGRGQDCNLVLQSSWVSTSHAQIQLSGRMLWIRDNKSTNGTFLNSKKIQGAEPIEDGDLVVFGNIAFCVRAAETDPTVSNDATLVFSSTMEQIGQAHYYRPQLLQIIKDRAVIPHFQSIRNLLDNSVLAYEVLGRVGGNDLPSNPIELFDIAAQLGCAIELSSLFREEGISQAKRLDESLQLFLNTHPLELLQIESIEQSLNKIRKEAPSIPVILEISEKAVTQSDQMNRLRAILKDLDIGLAYDDFGVGQTRLVELAELPPDFLKFDMSIICNIHLAPNRLHQMVSTFINAAHEMGTATIAEGIENEQESEKCKQLGFDYAQGFFYDKPQPISHLLQ